VILLLVIYLVDHYFAYLLTLIIFKC